MLKAVRPMSEARGTARSHRLGVMSEQYLTADEIRAAFLIEVRESPNGRLAYSDLWDRLQRRGSLVRGSTPKRQRDIVHKALSRDPRIQRVEPGVFAAR